MATHLQVGEVTHPNKPKHWIISRYFGRFVQSRQDRWVFGDRDSGAYLLKFAWTKITRHTLVKGGHPPTTPPWPATGRPGGDAAHPRWTRPGSGYSSGSGRCPLCGELLLHADQEPRHPDEWEQWIKAVRTATRHQAITLGARPGTQAGPAAPYLIHTHCQRRLDGTGGGPALLHPAPSLQGLLPSRTAWKTGTAGSEGTPARQRAAATRLEASRAPRGAV